MSASLRSTQERRFWLMKSEPEECSIDDALAAPMSTVPWVGVRNYQARNFMRDAMRPGDGVLFWHSGCEPPGIAGLAEVASAAYADPTQFDAASPYFDATARPDAPRWVVVDVRALRRTRYLTPTLLREHESLAGMQVLRRGNRLSITPIAPDEWIALQRLLA